MIRMIMGMGLAAWCISGTSAFTKAHDPNIDLKVEQIAAIHVPTGCASVVEYDDGAFVKAFITDPLCLPFGVTKRFVPSSEDDFLAPDPLQAAIKGQ